MKYNQARELAIKVGEKLKPYCTIINIVGSIRRQKPEPKDIELICLPRYLDTSRSDLFGNAVITKIISINFVDTAKSLGKVIKGQPNGRYMQIELSQRINLDLFMPDHADYWRQYVIRTGSAEYAHKTIAAAWLRKGWCGSDKGLRRQEDCRFEKTADGKGKWICLNPDGERPPVWESEKDFLSWVGIPWIMPKLRTI